MKITRIIVIFLQIILVLINLVIFLNFEEFKKDYKKPFKKIASTISNYVRYQFQKITNTSWNENFTIKRLKSFGKPLYIMTVIAHYNEDLDWVKKLKYPHIIISRKGIQSETKPNKGNEASVYLEYIVNNYKNLPDVCIFVHGHRNDWHHATYMDHKLNGMIFSHKYYNINEAPIEYITEDMIFVPGLMNEIESTIGKIDYKKIRFRKSAQFYVFKELIVQHPLEYYQSLLNWLWSTPHPSYKTGRILEYLWHYIFTGSYIDVM